MEKKKIDNIRKALQTLPNYSKKNYKYDTSLKYCNVNLIDCSSNVMKDIVSIACSTWGSGETGLDNGSMSKWKKLTPQNRYIVVLSALTGNTLLTALESPCFTFEINGVPRSTFDQFARCRFFSIGSIGTRDNDKLDAPFLIYDRLYKLLQEDNKLKKDFEIWVKITKDLYEQIISNSKGDYQLGRDVLPISLNHSWTFKTDYLTLKGQCSRRMMACEQDSHVLLFWKLREEIKNKISPLLANYLQPACDGAKKCIYHGGAEGLTKYFSSLFANCGRWPEEHKYNKFNHSCSDYIELSKYVEIVRPNEWINYTENDYDKLDKKDKKLFESN